MKVLVVGGTGFAGYHIVRELVDRGHHVTVLARGEHDALDDSVTVRRGDIQAMGAREMDNVVAGHTAIVYAASAAIFAPRGQNDNAFYRQANVEPVARLLSSGGRAGCDRAVVLGSYYATLHRQHPSIRLAEKSPYIQSRIEQAAAARNAAGSAMSVAVLELPFVIGATPGRHSPLLPQVQRLLHNRIGTVVYPGGTALISVSAVARATVNALERKADDNFPVATANLTWAKILHHLADAAGKRTVPRPIPLNRFLTRALFAGKDLRWKRKGLHSGLNMQQMGILYATNTFLDLEVIRRDLGVCDDDVPQALRDTVHSSQE